MNERKVVDGGISSSRVNKSNRLWNWTKVQQGNGLLERGHDLTSHCKSNEGFGKPARGLRRISEISGNRCRLLVHPTVM